jgi:hypothetical protein
MKKFILQVLLFSLPPLVVCAGILFMEPERKEMWTRSPDDCDNRGSWIYQRIFTDTTPIQIAFLGTSHTINGIQDTLIGRIYNDATGQNFHAVNLGYCRFGNEMQYIILKDLLEHKRPLLVVIEINEGMGQSSHPMYPYYASNKDLLSPASFLNQAVPVNYYNGFLSRLTHWRSDLYGFQDTAWPQFQSYGYRGYPGVAPEEELIEPEKNPESGSVDGQAYPRAWITKTVELCNASLVQVKFLYIPSYHDQPKPLEGFNFYTNKADVWIMPRDSVSEKSLWRDQDHLNDAGASVFSRWLAFRITETQLFGPYIGK